MQKSKFFLFVLFCCSFLSVGCKKLKKQQIKALNKWMKLSESRVVVEQKMRNKHMVEIVKKPPPGSICPPEVTKKKFKYDYVVLGGPKSLVDLDATRAHAIQSLAKMIRGLLKKKKFIKPKHYASYLEEMKTGPWRFELIYILEKREDAKRVGVYFTAGHWKGRVYLWDYKQKKVLCSGMIEARTKHTASVYLDSGMHKQSREKALKLFGISGWRLTRGLSLVY